jgi:precorrin-2 dehydrogenase/sirohydrochlorin ferrochelatase
MEHGYPVVMDLAGKRCLVLGTGREAEEKSEGLREAGAVVERITRPFQPGDLAGFFLAVAAGPDRTANAAIFAEAEQRGVLVNCIDDPPHCRFIFPSVHRQGDLVVAISTQGVAPALAVRIRERLQSELGPEYAKLLLLLRLLRERFAGNRELAYKLVDSAALDLLRRGRDEEAKEALERLLPPPR